MTHRPALALAALLAAGCATVSAPTAASARRAARRQALVQGQAALDARDYPRCGRLLEEAGRLYDAACCRALGGELELAFAALDRSAVRGEVSMAHLEQDPDLAALHADPRWPEAVAAYRRGVEARQRSQHPELLAIFEADQADRRGAVDWSVVGPRDEARRRRTRELVDAGALRVAQDHVHAAFVFQHGETVEDYALAHRLALEAVKLDPDDDGARWIAAATLDRKLMKEGRPQRYGTQFRRPAPGAPWELYPVDPSVTDEERAEWAVPSLAAARAQAAALNASGR